MWNGARYQPSHYSLTGMDRGKIHTGWGTISFRSVRGGEATTAENSESECNFRDNPEYSRSALWTRGDSAQSGNWGFSHGIFVRYGYHDNFSNLLDNAIDACMELDRSVKRIEVVLCQKMGLLALRMTNTCQAAADLSPRQWHSTKRIIWELAYPMCGKLWKNTMVWYPSGRKKNCFRFPWRFRSNLEMPAGKPVFFVRLTIWRKKRPFDVNLLYFQIRHGILHVQDILKLWTGGHENAREEKLEKSLLTGVAMAAKKTSQISAGQACMWWDYEPKMPKSVKKLRKFWCWNICLKGLQGN